jgi:alpha/beta superfamily hydrolase
MKIKQKILTLIFYCTSLAINAQFEETGSSFINSLLIEKNFSKAYAFFDDTVKSQISEQILQQTVNQLEAQLGKLKSIIETNNQNQTYFYYSDFEKMKLDIKISFNENNKIIGFFFVPHQTFKNEKSLGEDLNIKSSDIELKGTLLNPSNDTIKKMVIFIHGSGPNDRDETIYENKPFKDIAESLFKKGISSYRFDKRTLTNPETFNDKSTIDEEVIQDALNIVNYFKNNNQYKDYQIILLGHSFGGYLLPKISNQSNNINKIILLAANARPLDILIQEQYNYMYNLNPTNDLKVEIEKINKQVSLLNSKSFNLSTPKEELPLNLSAHYWNSLLEYKPLKEVKKVNIPIFILQGERDYQVTMTDYNLWKNVLKKHTNSTFISYPKLNHLFIAGYKKSEPKEYMIKGIVDDTVIHDIHNFIIKK